MDMEDKKVDIECEDHDEDKELALLHDDKEDSDVKDIEKDDAQDGDVAAYFPGGGDATQEDVSVAADGETETETDIMAALDPDGGGSFVPEADSLATAAEPQIFDSGDGIY